MFTTKNNGKHFFTEATEKIFVSILTVFLKEHYQDCNILQFIWFLIKKIKFSCLHIEEVDGCTSMVVSDCFVVIICDAVVDSGDRIVEIVVTGDFVVVVNSVVVFVDVFVAVVVGGGVVVVVLGIVVGPVVVGVLEVIVVVVDLVPNVGEGIEVDVGK